MALNIESDHNRFRKIVKGKIRENLRKFIKHSDMLGKKGKDIVSIPLPQIELPRFKHNPQSGGGVGQGDGDVGTPLGQGEDGQQGKGKAGDQPGMHIMEVELSIDELAEILGEELQLPRIQPRGKHKIESLRTRYRSISRVGPESLRHFKRTYKEALKRQIASGIYRLDNPIIIPIKEDIRYKSGKPMRTLESNAVIFYIMDISGSMGDEQKDIVRIESFWIDAWLRRHYPGLETRYIVHDVQAREVDREAFFSLRESGGTMISSAYLLLSDILEKSYSIDEWNIYAFHFSDGENWGDDDNKVCIETLSNRILNRINLFCYGQVASHYGEGDFLKILEESFKDTENISLSFIQDRDAIYDSIKTFLGKGR